MKAIYQELLETVHPSWQESMVQALELVDAKYLQECFADEGICPSFQKILAAFTLPREKVRYVLFGESPYPRLASANGYAFWDAAVNDLWSSAGLSKTVNRATSLRNMMKMLLHAEGLLAPPFLAKDIALLPKENLVKTLDSLFFNFLENGFLLLNASLIWSPQVPVTYHAKQWFPFNQFILNELASSSLNRFLLFGKIAQKFTFLPPEKCLIAEHPYVLSFIQNKDVISFFKPFNLLRASL